jgi:hypothetical protein
VNEIAQRETPHVNEAECPTFSQTNERDRLVTFGLRLPKPRSHCINSCRKMSANEQIVDTNESRCVAYAEIPQISVDGHLRRNRGTERNPGFLVVGEAFHHDG